MPVRDNIQTKKKYYKKYNKLYRIKKNLELKKSFGGRCEKCGYNKFIEILEFAHKKDTKKEFSISNWKMHNKSKLEEELKKCILLCPTCHREYDLNYTYDCLSG